MRTLAGAVVLLAASHVLVTALSLGGDKELVGLLAVIVLAVLGFALIVSGLRQDK